MHNHPNNYLHAIAARAHAAAARMQGILKEASDGPIQLGSLDTYKHFRGIAQSELSSGRFTRPITVTDIETGNNDQVISVAALKGVIDKRTGEFRVLDTYEKYYTPEKTYSQSFNMAREVHKLTPEKIAKLRDLQAAQGFSYGEKYDDQEAQSLMTFLHGSLVVGHNVEEFDFPRLGIAQSLQSEDILDTLVWAENAGVPRGKRGLAKLFKHYTGRSLSKAGYSHHFGFHDVLSNAELLSSLYMHKDRAGRDLRFVAGHQGFSYGAYEGAAGTAIIKGGYYQGRGPRGLEHYMYEDEFDEKGVFEYDYDENGKRILPEGFSETGEWDDPEELGISQANIFRLEAGNTFRALREELARVRETMLGYSVSQRHALTRYLANKDPEIAEQYLKGLKYSDKQVEEMMKQTLPLRIDKERKKAERRSLAATAQREKVSDLIGHMYRIGDISKSEYQWLSDVNDESSGYGPREIAYRAKEMAAERADRLKEVRAQRLFEESKDHKIDRYKKYHYLSEADEAALRATKSFEELSDAIEDVTKKNEEHRKVLGAIAAIKPYDINNLISAARGQWQGVMGATRGVVPGFLRNPIGRLGDAAFNAVDRSISPWNAFGRATSSILGPMAGMMMASGNPVAMGIGAGLGGLSALSQIGGNYAQAKVEMFGLQLQNNLNTLGAMISWITTPFQLLHKAIKLVTGAFGGLTFKLNNIMGSGINMMSQMGNPLEPLTGVNYVDYQRAGLVDMASLLKGGSTNAAIEDFAKMQRDLYRFGRVDTNKLLAANMLGVFNEAFTPTTDAEGSYYNMANKILRNMQGQNESQRADTMYYVTQLNDTLAQTIRSALMLGVTDVRDLTSPGDMYWNPIRSELTEEEKRRGVKYTEEQRFRRTQREYGIATQQFGYTKMRFADRLWNVIGRDLYNGFNKLIDHIAGGDWKVAIEDAKTMWTNLKNTFTKIWSGENGIGDSVNEGLSKGLTKIKQWGMDIAISIIDIWNQLFRVILDKAQGAIAYLSTAQIKLVQGENGWGLDITTIKDAKWDKNALLYNTDSSYNGSITSQTAKSGAKGFVALAEKIFPGMSKWDKQFLTQEKLATMLSSREEIMKNGGIVTPYIDLPQYHIHNLPIGEKPELVGPLLDYLMYYESGGAGMRPQAAANIVREMQPYLDEEAYNTGILPMYDKFVSDTMNTLYTARNMVSNDSRKLEADINVNVGDKKVGTVQIRNGGLTFEGFRPLSSTGYTKGIEVAGTKVSGGN